MALFTAQVCRACIVLRYNVSFDLFDLKRRKVKPLFETRQHWLAASGEYIGSDAIVLTKLTDVLPGYSSI
jgi:hypothetical protein